MPLSRYLKIFPCADKTGSFIVYSTKKGSVIKISADLLAAAKEDRLNDSDRRILNRLRIITDDVAGERAEICTMVSKANQGTSPIKAIAVLNLDCNLACPYCYEDPYRGKYYMSDAVAGQLTDFFGKQLRQGRDVSLDFYGGEALLSQALLKRIATFLADAALKYGQKFSFCMVTNGTLLTRKVVEELLPLGFTGARVTLDGPKGNHDRQRPFVSGKGSFDTIVRNLKETWDLIDLQVGGNFTAENHRVYPRLLDHLLAEGLTPDKLGLIQFAPIIPKASPAAAERVSGTCSSSSEPWLAEAALFLRKETLKRGFAVHKATMAACMVEFSDYLAINYDGSLYKCPAFIGWPEMSVGTLTAGVTDYAASHNLDLWKNDECLDCSYLPICFGGCRYLTLAKHGSIDRVDCRKEFYDTTLEAILRQDLSYGKSSAKRPANGTENLQG